MQQGALPRAARTDDGQHLAAGDFEVHAVEHGDRPAVAAAVFLPEFYGLEHHHSCRIASTGYKRAACNAG